MPLDIGNLVVETTSTELTGTYELNGAVTGRQRFRSATADGEKIFYFCTDGASHEAGVGTLTYGTPDTLSRDTILSTSAGDTNPISWGSGAKLIYCEVPAESTVYRDPASDYVRHVATPVADVRDWGIRPDTDNDLTSEIQAAADEALHLYFPDGEYLSQYTTVRAGAVWQGQSRDRTIIKRVPGLFVSNAWMKANPGKLHLVYGPGIESFAIRSMTLDGSAFEDNGDVFTGTPLHDCLTDPEYRQQNALSGSTGGSLIYMVGDWSAAAGEVQSGRGRFLMEDVRLRNSTGNGCIFNNYNQLTARSFEIDNCGKNGLYAAQVPGFSAAIDDFLIKRCGYIYGGGLAFTCSEGHVGTGVIRACHEYGALIITTGYGSRPMRFIDLSGVKVISVLGEILGWATDGTPTGSLSSWRDSQIRIGIGYLAGRLAGNSAGLEALISVSNCMVRGVGKVGVDAGTGIGIIGSLSAIRRARGFSLKGNHVEFCHGNGIAAEFVDGAAVQGNTAAVCGNFHVSARDLKNSIVTGNPVDFSLGSSHQVWLGEYVYTCTAPHHSRQSNRPGEVGAPWTQGTRIRNVGLLPDWADGTDYEAGDPVVDPDDGNEYTADSDHTAAEANRPSSGTGPWTLVGAAPLAPVVTEWQELDYYTIAGRYVTNPSGRSLIGVSVSQVATPYNYRGDWAGGLVLAVDDTVTGPAVTASEVDPISGEEITSEIPLYRTAIAHTAGTLSTDIAAGKLVRIRNRGAWTGPGTSYVKGDTVTGSGTDPGNTANYAQLYFRAASDHTSTSDFHTDYATSGYWTLIAETKTIDASNVVADNPVANAPSGSAKYDPAQILNRSGGQAAPSGVTKQSETIWNVEGSRPDLLSHWRTSSAGSPGTMRPVGLAYRGHAVTHSTDADLAWTHLIHDPTVSLTAAITADRSVTLSTPASADHRGAWVEITRESTATGNFQWLIKNAGGSVLFRLYSPGTSVLLRYTGAAWQVVRATVLTVPLRGSVTRDIASMALGATDAAFTVTVPGAAVGDEAHAWGSAYVAGLVLHAQVSAADTVTVIPHNLAGTNPLDPASMTVHVRVEKRP